MQIIEFDPLQEIPLVDVLLIGPLAPKRLKLVFDTGCAVTQVDTSLMETAGYSASDGLEVINVRGPTGDKQEGYLVRSQSLKVFGTQFDDIEIGVYDFDNFSQYGIDGLLGWNVIRRFHLEMNGPEGVLKIF